MAARSLAGGGSYARRAVLAELGSLMGFAHIHHQDQKKEEEIGGEETGGEETGGEEKKMMAARALDSGGADTRLQASRWLNRGLPAGSCSPGNQCFQKRQVSTWTNVTGLDQLQLDLLAVSKTWSPSSTNPFIIDRGDEVTGHAQMFTRLLDLDKMICKRSLPPNCSNESYYQTIKPALRLRGLISPYPFDHPKTRQLHQAYKRILGQFPRYITSYTLMENLETMAKNNWVHFLDFLSAQRIIVVEDWTTTLITSSCADFYDHGQKCPPDDSMFFKGECDASFSESECKAKICILIWKGNQVICCRVLDNISCSKSVEAEAMAMYFLLKSAVELSIDHLQVSTDNETVDKVMRGVFQISENEQFKDLFKLLRYMRRYFKKLTCRWESRVKLSFVDELIRAPKIAGDVEMKDLLRKWAYMLNGFPVFNFCQKKSKVISDLVDKTAILDDIEKLCYLEVDADKKVQALWHLAKALRPSKMFIATRDIESRPGFKEEIKELFDDCIIEIIEGKTSSAIAFSLAHRVETNVLSTKDLIVRFDLTIPKEEYPQENALTVLLTTPDENDLVSKMGIPELSPFSFASFHEHTRSASSPSGK